MLLQPHGRILFLDQLWDLLNSLRELTVKDHKGTFEVVACNKVWFYFWYLTADSFQASSLFLSLIWANKLTHSLSDCGKFNHANIGALMPFPHSNHIKGKASHCSCSLKKFSDLLESHPALLRKPHYVSGKSLFTTTTQNSTYHTTPLLHTYILEGGVVCVCDHLNNQTNFGCKVYPASVEWSQRGHILFSQCLPWGMLIKSHQTEYYDLCTSL